VKAFISFNRCRFGVSCIKKGLAGISAKPFVSKRSYLLIIVMFFVFLMLFVMTLVLAVIMFILNHGSLPYNHSFPLHDHGRRWWLSRIDIYPDVGCADLDANAGHG
jgi:hypothetical protein